MYREGKGVPKDDVEVYKWSNLATTHADAEQREEFAEARDLTVESLTPEQRAEGQKLARKWFAAHPRE
jgi:TPR repeat protein